MRKIVQAISFTTIVAIGVLGQSAVAQQVTTLKISPAADKVPISARPGEETDVHSPEPDSPAPPLTRVFINNVCTDSGGTTCETISSGQTSTTNTYHGSAAYIFVWEIGYGSGEIATQGGAQISSTYLVGRVPVCQSGSYYTTSCPAGSSVVGFRYEWRNGYYLNQGYGIYFTAQDTSDVSPYNTYSASLTIKYSH